MPGMIHRGKWDSAMDSLRAQTLSYSALLPARGLASSSILSAELNYVFRPGMKSNN